MAPQTITISYPGMEPFTAEPLRIDASCDKNPTLPISMQDAQPECSRMLKILEKKQEQAKQQMRGACLLRAFQEGW